MGRNKHKKISAVDHWQSFPPRPMPHQQTYGYQPQYPYTQNGYYAPPVPQFIPDIWYPPQGYGPPYYANMQMHPSHGYRGQINASYSPNVQFPRSSYGTKKRNNFQHCPSSNVNWKQNAKVAKENAIKPNPKNNYYDNQQIKSNRKGNYDQSQMTYNSYNKNSKKGQYNPMALLINFIKGLKTKLDSIPAHLRNTIIDDFVKNAPIERTESCSHEANNDGECLYCLFGYKETSRLMQMLQYLQNILHTKNNKNKNEAKSQKPTDVKNKNNNVNSESLPVQNLVENEKPLVTQTSNANENEKENANAGETLPEPSENIVQKETLLENEIVNDNLNKINDSLDLSKLDSCNLNNLIVNEVNKYPDPSDQNNNRIKQDYLKKGKGLLGYQGNKVKEIVKNSTKSTKNKVKVNKKESCKVNGLMEKSSHLQPSSKRVNESVQINKSSNKINASNNVVQANAIHKNVNEVNDYPIFDMCGTIKFYKKICNPNWTIKEKLIKVDARNVPKGFELDDFPKDVSPSDSMIASALQGYARAVQKSRVPDVREWCESIVHTIHDVGHKYGVKIKSEHEQYWKEVKESSALLPLCALQVFAQATYTDVYMYYEGGDQPIIFGGFTIPLERRIYLWNISNVCYRPLKLMIDKEKDKEGFEKSTNGIMYKIDNIKIEGEKLLVKDEKTGEWK